MREDKVAVTEGPNRPDLERTNRLTPDDDADALDAVGNGEIVLDVLRLIDDRERRGVSGFEAPEKLDDLLTRIGD